MKGSREPETSQGVVELYLDSNSSRLFVNWAVEPVHFLHEVGIESHSRLSVDNLIHFCVQISLYLSSDSTLGRTCMKSRFSLQSMLGATLCQVPLFGSDGHSL